MLGKGWTRCSIW